MKTQVLLLQGTKKNCFETSNKPPIVVITLYFIKGTFVDIIQLVLQHARIRIEVSTYQQPQWNVDIIQTYLATKQA